MKGQLEKQEKSPSRPLSKQIKRIWYFFLAIGAMGVMLQDKFLVKETFGLSL